MPRGGLDIPDEDEMHVRADYMWSRQHYWGYHGDETLEEIYPYEWEDRMASASFKDIMPISNTGMTREEYDEYIKEFWIEQVREKLNRIGGDVPDRIDLLKRTGLYKRNL